MTQKVITGKVRIAYPALFTPRAFKAGDKQKYSVQVVVPKSEKATVDKIQAAIEAEMVEEFGPATKKGQLKIGFRDGDTEDMGPDYENCYFFNATNQHKPGTVDVNLDPIIDPDQISSGDWARVSVNVKAFRSEAKGITFYVNNVQWLEPGDPIGNRARPEDDFADAWGE